MRIDQVFRLDYAAPHQQRRVHGFAVLLLIMVPTVLLGLASFRETSAPTVMMGPPERQQLILDRRRDQADRLFLGALAWMCASSGIGYLWWSRSRATT